MSTTELKLWLRQNVGRIGPELDGGTYQPNPVRRVEIPKPGGRGMRKLGVPTVGDRVIQQAILQRLTPIFDPVFSEHSFGFRPGRSAKGAVREAAGYIEEGYVWVVDIDLKAYFDTVNHDMVMARVARKVKDKRVLRLIRAYLNAGVMVDGVVRRNGEGTPQGGPLSPLLGNILLDDLDKELEQRGHRFVRYADDVTIYVKSRRAGERVLASVTRYLEQGLKLTVNQEKSGVVRPAQAKVLGFSFGRQKGKVQIRLSRQTKQRIADSIRDLTQRSRSMAMSWRIKLLNEKLRGWMHYFALADTASVFRDLDAHLRRRLRACLLKQWKKPKTKYRNLRNLGVKDEEARKLAGSRKGTWRLSLTPQVNRALGNAFWHKTSGLISLADLYQQIRSA